MKTDVEHARHGQDPCDPFRAIVGFRFNAVDFKTQPFRRFYRCAIVPGRAETPPGKRDADVAPTHSGDAVRLESA